MKVLVAMSGGVDSSVAAFLLCEQGYDVAGITLKVWDYVSYGCKEKEKGCCSLDAINDAKEVARKLGIEHHIVDCCREFEQSVISDFIDEYLKGHTPNPCVVCNPLIKWKALTDKADELKCGYISTGHYARVREGNGRYILMSGADEKKDQSYVLWRLTQEHLSKTIFPLGGLVKKDIRSIACNIGFSRLSEKRESQEICFIPDDDYRAFLCSRIKGLDEKYAGGPFVSVDGKVLGTHKGFPFYTIGQRKGLGIALGKPAYVKEIHVSTNTIVLGFEEDLYSDEMYVERYNGVKYPAISDGMKAVVKIRYNNKGELCTLFNEEERIKVKFHNKVSAVTPGQSAVFYEGNDVVGGGVIM